jgi:hypothetical protein
VGRTSTALGEDLDGGGGTHGGGVGTQAAWTSKANVWVAWTSTAGVQVTRTSTVEALRCRGAREGGAVGEALAWRRSAQH